MQYGMRFTGESVRIPSTSIRPTPPALRITLEFLRQTRKLVPPLVNSIQPGSVASFPLRMTHADSYIGEDERGERIVLLGDAAHTIHPLAGQGLNMGLMDGKALAEAIHKAVLVGGDIGMLENRLHLQLY